MRFLRFIFLAVLIANLGLRPDIKTFILFDAQGQPVDEYDELVKNIRVGDILMFRDGSSFLVQEDITGGMNTRILGIGNDRVIRLPLTSHGSILFNYQQYLVGFEQLKKLGVPIPPGRVGTNGRYFIQEYVQKYFDLHQFLEGNFNFRMHNREKVFEELVEFARKCQAVAVIDDLHNKQLVYSDSGWILLDWGKVYAADSHLDFNIFTGPGKAAFNLEKLSSDETVRIFDAVQEGRAQNKMLPQVSFCDRLGLFKNRFTLSFLN